MPINPMIGSAIIGGVGSALGGLLGFGGSNKAAKYQLKAVRETNAMNYQIAQENNAFNRQMWQLQNQYNTPAAQRKRFEEAGLNPNLMMDGTSSGNAQTSVTADASGVQTAPDIGSTIASGYQQFGSNIAQGAQGIAQMYYNNELQKANAAKANAEARSQEISNDFAVAMHIADLTRKNWLNKFSEKNYHILKETQDDLISKIRGDAANAWSQNALTERQTDLAYTQNQIAQVQLAIHRCNLDWLPREKQANLAAVLQNTLTSASQMRMNDAAARNYVAMTALNWAQANGVSLDNDLKDSVFDLSVGLVENQYEQGRADAAQHIFGFNLDKPQALVYNTSGNFRQVSGKERSPIHTPHRYAKKSRH
nr:MAG TPA: DNA pilot protein VP2 [Microviridae sp.]